MTKRRSATAAGALVLALALASCSSSGSPSKKSSAATTGSSGSTATTGSGGSTPPKLTIGYVDIAATVSTEPQIYSVFKAGADKLGWKVELKDAVQDPSKALQATQLLVQEHVDVIVFSSMPASFVLAGVQAAKRANIPTIQIVTRAQKGIYDAQYIFSWTQATLAPLIQDMQKQLPAGAEVATMGSSVILGNSNLPATFKTALTSAGFKIVADADLPIGTIQQAYQQGTASIVRAHPNLKAIVDELGFVHDVSVGLDNANAGKDVKIFSVGATNNTIPTLIKPNSRLVSDIVPVNSELGLVALDNLLSHFGTSKTPLPAEQTASSSFLINNANLPSFLRSKPDSDIFPQTTESILAPFVAKWSKVYQLKN